MELFETINVGYSERVYYRIVAYSGDVVRVGDIHTFRTNDYIPVDPEECDVPLPEAEGYYGFDDIIGATEDQQTGVFRSVRGIAIDTTGNVLVANSGNNNIIKSNRFGRFITQWYLNGALQIPAGIALDASGISI